MIRALIKSLIGLLVFVLIVDPGDLIFHLKVPLFFLILVIWGLLKTYSHIRISRDILIVIFAFLTIPFVGLVVAIVQNNLTEYAFGLGVVKSLSIITLLIIIIDLRVAVDSYLIKLSIVIPLIIIPIYFLLSVNPGLFTSIYHYLSEKDVAKFSKRDFYGYNVIMLYYRTSPLLVFPLAFYCKEFTEKNNRFLFSILVALFFFTLILSGTRANMISGVIILMYYLFLYLKRLKNKIPLILTCFLLLVGILQFLNSLSFRKKDYSTEVKSDHYNSYIDLFNDKPHYLIWGQGLGSTFYSSGNNAYVRQTELTYFELVRWFGVPITVVFLFLLLYPIIYLYKNRKIDSHNRYAIIAYLTYLFIAGTNPLLVSSTGMLAIIIIYSFTYKSSSSVLIRGRN